jgi:carbonic anhydrase
MSTLALSLHSLQRLSAICAVYSVALACTPESPVAPPPAVAAAAQHAEWTYTGPSGPEHWGDLDPSFASCARGTKQSPIDLSRTGSIPSTGTIGSHHWDPVPLSIRNTGHTVQVDDTAASSVVVDGMAYSLVQFHLHAPAEHTLDGRSFDAELHLVHKAPDGRLAVVALLLQRGAKNPLLSPFFEAMPLEVGPAHGVPGQTIDIGALVPVTSRFLSYDGSLTSPPCTEGVRWLVVVPEPAPLEIAEADLAKFEAAVHGANRRPVQPRNGRSVELRAP